MSDDAQAKVAVQVEAFHVTVEPETPIDGTDTKVVVRGTWEGHRIPGDQWRLRAGLPDETTVERIACFGIHQEAIEEATRIGTHLLAAYVRHVDAEQNLDALVTELGEP